MTTPAATVELLLRYFGVGANPTYGATLDILDRDPYQPVRQKLEREYVLQDITDFNYDLGNEFSLSRGHRHYLLRLSFVGPYALLLGPDGNPTHEETIERIVVEEGFRFLTREELEVPVTIWEPEFSGRLYELLFEFDMGLPWNRDR